MENPQPNNTNPPETPPVSSLGLPAMEEGQLGGPALSLDSPYPQNTPVAPEEALLDPSKQGFWNVIRRFRILIMVALVLAGGSIVLIRRNAQPVSTVKAGDFSEVQLSLAEFEPHLPDDSLQTITVNGQLQIARSLVISPSVQPSSGVAGQIYYDEATNQLSYHNGTGFVPVAGNTTFIQNTTNVFGDSITNVTNATAGITTVGGTSGKLLKFTSAQTAGDSIVTDNGSHIGINGGINISADTSVAERSLFTPATAPTSFDTTDTTPAVELGVKFQVDVPGVVKAVRFYKSPTQTGTFIGSLWTSGGSLLGQATFTVSASGWQQVDFPSPVPVSPDTTYIASYHNTPATPGSVLGYPFDAGRFGAGSIDNVPLHGLASGLDGGNGVFKYSASPSVPNASFNSTNYFVDLVFAGSVFTDESRIRINNTQLSSSDLANDSNLAKRASSQVFSGNNIFRNGSDSAAPFSIQKADTTALFTVDTASSRVYIGPVTGNSTGVLLVLGYRTTNADDPPGTDGALYYNSTSQTFRCYRDTEWSECGEVTVNQGFTLYDEFMGGQTTAFATNNIIGSLGWNSQAIGANGSINFNPTTPTPIADRPGVLVLQTPAVTNQGTTLMLANSNGASMILAKGNTVRAAVAVGATSNQVLRVGLHTETTGTGQPVSGVWFEADPSANANWRYCYGNGTTATCANSTTAITANTWVRLEIRVTATGAGTSAATFRIDSQTFNVTLATFDITNRVSPAFSCYTTANTAQSCYWDYFQLRGATSAVR